MDGWGIPLSLAQPCPVALTVLAHRSTSRRQSLSALRIDQCPVGRTSLSDRAYLSSVRFPCGFNSGQYRGGSAKHPAVSTAPRSQYGTPQSVRHPAVTVRHPAVTVRHPVRQYTAPSTAVYGTLAVLVRHSSRCRRDIPRGVLRN